MDRTKRSIQLEAINGEVTGPRFYFNEDGTVGIIFGSVREHQESPCWVRVHDSEVDQPRYVKTPYDVAVVCAAPWEGTPHEYLDRDDSTGFILRALWDASVCCKECEELEEQPPAAKARYTSRVIINANPELKFNGVTLITDEMGCVRAAYGPHTKYEAAKTWLHDPATRRLRQVQTEWDAQRFQIEADERDQGSLDAVEVPLCPKELLKALTDILQD